MFIFLHDMLYYKSLWAILFSRFKCVGEKEKKLILIVIKLNVRYTGDVE